MRILLSAIAATALLAACGDNGGMRIATKTENDEGGPLKVVSELQCPATQGDLTRKGTVSADGLSCTYLGPRGSEVVLTLVKLDGKEPKTALDALEAQLKGDLPETSAQLAARATASASATSGTDTATVQAPGVDIQADGDNARVNLPGISIDAQGDKASVRIGGINVQAEGDNADVNIQGEDESVSIQAQNDAAEIRTTQAGSGVRATYILADDNPSAAGWRMVGYVARGPSTGPLVVATVRSKSRDNDGLRTDAERLVTLNTGE